MNLKSLNKQELSEKIKAEAKNLGFFACGIAQASSVEDDTARHVRRWLAEENYAGMAYMNNYTDKRLDPRLLMDGLKSIVCVALNYAPAQDFGAGEFRFAAYALGQDYHDIVKNKLRLLADKIGINNYRVFCDSAPVLERYWATQAGLGWTGKNHQLIIPHAGSMFFLGELFLDIELEYDKPARNRCGNCHKCIDHCPTGALQEGRELNSLACLSYQTIENRDDIPPEYASKMGKTIYGCDRCQQVCPWNRFARPNDTPELQPKAELLGMKRADWLNLSEEDYRKLFKGSAVKRAKYSGLMRNIKAATCYYEGKELTLNTKQEDDE
uniref:tRNA epoxyqueuosine(34) reductase QueG n=1 Tax=Prevotella sp. GTC17254 TaxID=3236794 RepID=A0AB33J198_9BACT